MAKPPLKRPKSQMETPSEQQRLVAVYISTIIDPSTTSAMPLLYATGPTTQKLSPQCTFAKVPYDFPQTGYLQYNENHRMVKNNAGGDFTITDAIQQPLQLLTILGDQATQAGMFEIKNSIGADCPYRWTSANGSTSFICTAVPNSAGSVFAVNSQIPAMFETIDPINANFDSTVMTELLNSTVYTGIAGSSGTSVATNLSKNFEARSYHGLILPAMRANGFKYMDIDACNQVMTNNNNTQLPPLAAYYPIQFTGSPAALNQNGNVLTGYDSTVQSAAGIKNILTGSTSSCITVSEGDSSLAMQKIYPKLQPFQDGDRITIVANQFRNNTDGNPAFEASFTIPTGWTAGTIATNKLICILPIPFSDKWRLRVSILSASGTSATSMRAIRIGQTNVGGMFCRRMAPACDSQAILSVASASRLWANGINFKNWTTVSGRGGRALVYKMQKGDYESEAFGIDAGDPATKMGSQPDELDETFELGEKFYNTPPCEEEENALFENIDQPMKKTGVAVPPDLQARFPYSCFYNGIDRNLTGQVLVSPGVQNTVTPAGGGTNVVVNQQQAQSVDITWWVRWEVVVNGVEGQIFYRQLPPRAKGIFEVAAGRTALMKKAGPSASTIDFFIRSEGYLERNARRMGSGAMV